MDRDAYMADLKEKIAAIGFTLVGVFDPEGKEPPFVYSIGLTERGWPEVLLITACMRPITIEILLTDIINRWFKEEKVVMGDNPDLIMFADGSSHAMRVVEVEFDGDVMDKYGCQVPVFYPGKDIRFVQVMWPDKAGKFPDEEGYSTDPSMIQPFLGRK